MIRTSAALALSCALLQAVGAAAASGPWDPGGDTILAKVGDEAITVGRFRYEMKLRGAAVPGAFSTLDQRRALLDEMIRFRTWVVRARQAGYDRKPDVVAVFERAMVNAFKKDHSLPPEALSVSDEEVTAYYAEHQAEYDRPERVQAAIVFFACPSTATEKRRATVENRVEQALAEAQALEPHVRDFGPVARKYSEDRASRYTGGVIGWLINHPDRRSRWEEPVVEAIFSLDEPGQIGDIIRTEKGYYLVRLVEREPAAPRPLDQVEAGIRHHLMRTKGRAAEEALDSEIRNGLDITINEEIFSEIKGPPPAADAEHRPPQLPKG